MAYSTRQKTTIRQTTLASVSVCMLIMSSSIANAETRFTNTRNLPAVQQEADVAHCREVVGNAQRSTEARRANRTTMRAARPSTGQEEVSGIVIQDRPIAEREARVASNGTALRAARPSTGQEEVSGIVIENQPIPESENQRLRNSAIVRAGETEAVAPMGDEPSDPAGAVAPMGDEPAEPRLGAEASARVLQSSNRGLGRGGEESGIIIIEGQPGGGGEEEGIIIINGGQPGRGGEETGIIIIEGRPGGGGEEQGIIIIEGHPTDSDPAFATCMARRGYTQ